LPAISLDKRSNKGMLGMNREDNEDIRCMRGNVGGCFGRKREKDGITLLPGGFD